MPVVSHTAAQVVAAFGAVDTQNGQWAGLLPALLHSVNDPNVPLQTKIASLEVSSNYGKKYIRSLSHYYILRCTGLIS